MKKWFLHFVSMSLVWVSAYFVFFQLQLSLPDDRTDILAQMSIPLFVFNLRQSLFTGIFTGGLFTLADILFQRLNIMRLTYGQSLAIKVIVHGAIASLVLLTTFQVLQWLFPSQLPDSTTVNIPETVRIYPYFIYFGMTSFMIDFIKQVNQKFGQGVLLNMLLGKYHRPKEEERVFMFIDLKSSTSIAENIGHYRYSQLLQDCFYDVNFLVPRYDAEIYQYVGDEVVLHWSTKSLKGDLQLCIDFYFAFLKRLDKRAHYYIEQYGLIPEFRAAAHKGLVTVAEVGVIKKDIAYHGDTLNTTSRIQDLCRVYPYKLLLSEEMADKIKDGHYKIKHIASEQLRGKKEETAIYAVIAKELAPDLKVSGSN